MAGFPETERADGRWLGLGGWVFIEVEWDWQRALVKTRGSVYQDACLSEGSLGKERPPVTQVAQGLLL